MKPNKNIENALRHMYNIATGGHTCDTITKLSAAGSNRKYYRIYGNAPFCPSMIGTVGTNQRENRAFTYLSQVLGYDYGLNVPQVYAETDGIYLQQDLGDTSLFNLISEKDVNGEITPQAKQLVRDTVRLLPGFQWLPIKSINWEMCYPVGKFDMQSVMWDLNYFKYCFLKTVGLEFDESRLETDLTALASAVLSIMPQTLVLRDFQSRNIMIHSGKPYVIDFQGARLGPCQYDLVSFLWQIRAGFSDSLKAEMIDEYLDAASLYADIDRDAFMADLNIIVLFRTLQVLGAYGFRGLVENKPHFMKSLLPAVRQLDGIVGDEFMEQFPYLRQILRLVPGLPLFTNHKPVSDRLVVTVNSFGFRKSGIPKDLSGNGGGFVFDCRALPNPGRLAEFASSTGMDLSVTQYLEQYEDVSQFLNDVFNIVDMSVARYIQRNFTDLTISFGCTGGQHRSVYCAERTARHLQEKFKVDVYVNHTEQNVTKLLTDRQHKSE